MSSSKFNFSDCDIGNVIGEAKTVTQTIDFSSSPQVRKNRRFGNATEGETVENIVHIQGKCETHTFGAHVGSRPSEESCGIGEEIRMNYNEQDEYGAEATRETRRKEKEVPETQSSPKINSSKAYLQLKIRLKKLIEEDQQHFKELKESLNDDKSMEYSSRDAEFDDSAHKVLQRLDQLTKISEDSVKPLLEFAKNAASGFGDDSWFHKMVDLLWTYQSQYCRY